MLMLIINNFTFQLLVLRAKEEVLRQYSRVNEANRLKMEIDRMNEDLSDEDDSVTSSQNSDVTMQLMDERSFNIELGKINTSL